MIPVEDAQKLILAAVEAAPAERVDLLAAVGRVLAETVVARADFPPYDNSAMDGYAVRATDAPLGTLEVIEVIAAGQMPERPIGPGQCARIMTGAMLSAGADTVIMQEQVQAADGRIRFEGLPEAGTNVRRRGSFHPAGASLLAAGSPIGPGEAAILAANGRSFVAVHRAPTVAILSTGDELVPIDALPGPVQIIDSNGYGLAAQTRAAGGIPRLLGIANDAPAVIGERLTAALDGADFVLTSGGASVGQFDYLPQVLEELGAEVILYKINMKPGKPLLFARLGRRLVWGLPGNPVSSLFCFWQFVRPAIRKFLGYPEPFWRLPVVSARLDAPVRSKGDRRTYFRGQVRHGADGWHFQPYRTDNSGDLASLAGINAFAWLEAGVTAATEGEAVPVLLVGEFIAI
jgi:molybdopterin molybdotransferase